MVSMIFGSIMQEPPLDTRDIKLCTKRLDQRPGDLDVIPSPFSFRVMQLR